MIKEELKTVLKQAMEDRFQRNVRCDYTFIQGNKVMYEKNLLALDAYLMACEFSQHGDVECYMTPMGVKAFRPVFTITSGVAKLSGQRICMSKEEK